MIKRNQWYKLTEGEFTDILRFVDKDIANNEKYIESLNRVGDAYTRYKVLYVQLQYHHFPSQGLYNKFYAWHYRSSYSEYYCGQCLEYADIVFDKCCDTIDAARYALKCCDKDRVYGPRPLTATEQNRKAVEEHDKSYLDNFVLEKGDKLCYRSSSGNMFTNYVHDSAGKKVKDSVFAYDDIFSITRNNKVIYDKSNSTNIIIGAPLCADKEEKVMEENKIQAITSIIRKYEDEAGRKLTRQYDEQEKEVKAKDPNVIALREYIGVLNKNRAENTEPYDTNCFNEIYTAETAIQLDKLYNTLMGKKRVLREQCDEVRNLCMLCDTYEQMRQVLADYEIIPNTKKRGK